MRVRPSSLVRLPSAALAGAILLCAGAAAQDAYLHHLPGQAWIGAKATEILQPNSGEEFLVAATDNFRTEIYVATFDDRGKLVNAITYTPPTPGASVVDLRTFEHQGKERIALLLGDGSSSVSLWLLDSSGKLLVDWTYPVTHPTQGTIPVQAQSLAWDPVKERLAIVLNKSWTAGAYDFGLFTTNGVGKIVDEMRWYEFAIGGSFSAQQAFAIEADPWHGGFLIGVYASAWWGSAGFLLLPVTHAGDPDLANVPWITGAFLAKDLSIDEAHGQVLVVGEDFAFGPGVSFSDVCMWVEDGANVRSGTIATPGFSRFRSVTGSVEQVRKGAFGAVDPTIYSVLGSSQGTPAISFFDVSPGLVKPRSRVATHLFGGRELLHLPSYTVNGAGYGLDQVVVGGGNGSFTHLVRRTSTGERDPHCETAPPKLTLTGEPFAVQLPSVDVEITYHVGASLGVAHQPRTVTIAELCAYDGFEDGTAN
ncbi:MAG: hypothetical protein ACF8XB_01665 [Planctomycetota bacterium JB042]